MGENVSFLLLKLKRVSVHQTFSVHIVNMYSLRLHVLREILQDVLYGVHKDFAHLLICTILVIYLYFKFSMYLKLML